MLILNTKTVFYLCISLLGVFSYTDVPVIGILSQEAYSIQKYFPDEVYHSFIAASYVKFLESAGARVIPVWIGQSEDYYRRIVELTNGILFPGGATWFNESNGYADAGQHLYDIALEVNSNGDYYPIWGTCLGMELLVQVAIGGQEIRAHCLATKVSYALEFVEGYNTSNLFSETSEEIIEILATQNVTYNYHRYCVTEQNFTEYGLSENWRILSTNRDVNGLEFISTLESKYYPFYGIQFHPEKNQYEFKIGSNIEHSRDAVKTSQYFANFFVEEARKNNHSFLTWGQEQDVLIYNYNASFIGNKNSTYQQVYVFKKTDYENNYV